jgi:ABC-type multidrug transport system fused ATPase/permease subunit
MLFFKIIKDYIKKNKANVILYITCSSLDNIVKVLLTSRIYSSFLKEDADIYESLKNVVYVWILKFVLSYCKSYLESIIIPDVTFYMRNRLFNDYIRINEIDFNDIDVSVDMRQIIDLTKLIRDLFIWLTDSVIPLTILMICIDAYFFITYPTVGIINIIGNLSSIYVILQNYKKILESSVAREELFIKLVEKIDEKMNNLMNIFLNNKTDDTIKNNEKLEREYIENYRQQYRELEDFSTNVKLVNYSFAGTCLFALYKSCTPDTFVNGLLIYTFYIQAFETITEEIPRYMVMISNLKHIESYLEKKIYDRVQKQIIYSNNLEDFEGNIQFINVSFKYEKIDIYYNNKKTEEEKQKDELNVINNLNLKIDKGDRISIVAKSGSGKSTLMKLLLGFYRPQKGNIFLDGKDITTINPSLIRNKINYINQKTLLFHDTIINNMKYGNNKTDREVINFLKKYNLLYIFKDCQNYPDRCLNKMVENNGTNISLGMQKIIFLVRGILKDSPVYIFDEPLTSVDPLTRRDIIKMIGEETKGKTLIIITHDNEINSIVNRQVNLNELMK